MITLGRKGEDSQPKPQVSVLATKPQVPVLATKPQIPVSATKSQVPVSATKPSNPFPNKDVNFRNIFIS